MFATCGAGLSIKRRIEVQCNRGKKQKRNQIFLKDVVKLKDFVKLFFTFLGRAGDPEQPSNVDSATVYSDTKSEYSVTTLKPL